MLVLGISDLEHDTSAVLVGGQGPIAAVEEDKLSRSSAPSGIPHLAIERCLREVGAQAGDLSLTVVACRLKRAWLREQRLRLRLLGSHAGPLFRKSAQNSLFWRLTQLRL